MGEEKWRRRKNSGGQSASSVPLTLFSISLLPYFLSLKPNTTIAITLFLIISVASVAGGGASAVGDGGMRRDELRVAFEAWNFCNEVGAEAPAMGSPRAADCFDLTQDTSSMVHKVSEADNRLGVGTPFPGLKPEALNNPDLYAAEKELYLGSLCQVSDSPTPWQFWMEMLKNGNYDARSGLCPENGKKAPPFKPGRFPCFGTGCMNQPSLCHQPTAAAPPTAFDSSRRPEMAFSTTGTEWPRL